MDVSPEYVKMCDCEEIQAQNPNTPQNKGFEQGNWYSYHGDEPFVEDYDYIVAGAIWLPRQDQLQEMVGETPYYNIKNAMFSVLDDFRNFAFATNLKKYIPSTMEQVWLAFVMKGKYNKVWNGENWVVPQ